MFSNSEMPSKIPTYSVYPNNSPDTDYEQDYETPAPGPPPTRSGHQNFDENEEKDSQQCIKDKSLSLYFSDQLVVEWLLFIRALILITHVVPLASFTGRLLHLYI